MEAPPMEMPAAGGAGSNVSVISGHGLVVSFHPAFKGHETTAILIQNVDDSIRVLDALTNAMAKYVGDTEDWQIFSLILDDHWYLDCTLVKQQCNKNFASMWRERTAGAQHGLHSMVVFVGPTYFHMGSGMRAELFPVGESVERNRKATMDASTFVLSTQRDGSNVVLMRRFLPPERDTLPHATYSNDGRDQQNVQVFVRYRGKEKDWKT